MNSLHATAALFAASLAALAIGELLPEPPTELRAKVAKSIQLTWTCEGTNELFGIYESSDLVNWQFREATTNLVWRLEIPSFTDEHKFFTVATLTNSETR